MSKRQKKMDDKSPTKSIPAVDTKVARKSSTSARKPSPAMSHLIDANISVIGIGAMGGSMARNLLRSPVSKYVVGFDQSNTLVDSFFAQAAAAHKAPPVKPSYLAQAITKETQFILLVLQTEAQCETVCFGGELMNNISSLAAPGCCVILSSTVSAEWAKQAEARFRTKNILFVDCPVSGGPARALEGDLTLMASGDVASLDYARPILDAMGSHVHIVVGGAGMGSTAKMVHQLLAGVHICVAAEAFALAAKAGLDVNQLYEIVNGAAGASWMFQDRGMRMLQPDPHIMSQLQIFVKDLDIVHAEAKRHQTPVPIASAALQQFISGQSLGLGKKDDSQVVKVYENITGVSVSSSSKDSAGNVGGMDVNNVASI
jgi:putative dehydrogenase